MAVVPPVAPFVVCMRVCSDEGKREAALVVSVAAGLVVLILIALAVHALLDRWRR